MNSTIYLQIDGKLEKAVKFQCDFEVPEGEEAQTWTKYCDRMNGDGTWASHLEIKFMSQMLKRNIVIIKSYADENNRSEIEGSYPGHMPEHILLGHVMLVDDNGKKMEGHYVSLMPSKGWYDVQSLVLEELCLMIDSFQF